MNLIFEPSGSTPDGANAWHAAAYGAAYVIVENKGFFFVSIRTELRIVASRMPEYLPSMPDAMAFCLHWHMLMALEVGTPH